MKQTQYLSNYQKQQYTQYLESQLQKFSAFMLSQKKENQKYKHLQDMISHQNHEIVQLRQKMEIVQLYTKENQQNHQIVIRSNRKNQEMQDRLRRLEDRLRFGCDKQRVQRHSQHHQRQTNIKESSVLLLKLQKNIQQINKKVKYLEQDMNIIKHTSTNHGFKTQRNTEQTQNLIDKKALKKFQKKMNKNFALKFDEIQSIIRKTYRKKSKSPSFVTPVQGCHSQSSILNNRKLSQFKINDQVQSILKSDISTVSRDTKKQQSSFLELNKRKHIKSNNSRSKSKGLSKSRSKSRSISRISEDQRVSKTKRADKSKNKRQRSKSQDSYIKSSISHSKLNKSKIRDTSISKSKSKSKRKSQKSKTNQQSQLEKIYKKSFYYQRCRLPQFHIQQSQKLKKKTKQKHKR